MTIQCVCVCVGGLCPVDPRASLSASEGQTTQGPGPLCGQAQVPGSFTPQEALYHHVPSKEALESGGEESQCDPWLCLFSGNDPGLEVVRPQLLFSSTKSLQKASFPECTPRERERKTTLLYRLRCCFSCGARIAPLILFSSGGERVRVNR